MDVTAKRRIWQEVLMAQTDNPFLDGMAKAFTDAAGMAQSVRTEIDTFVRQRLERLVADMDFVPREEFEAVKAMAAKARAENEALTARIAALEDRVAAESAPRKPSKKAGETAR